MIKVRTLFSGIGSPESALKKLGVDFEIVDFCERDKYAVKSYCAITWSRRSKEPWAIYQTVGDTTSLPYADLLVFGVSLARIYFSSRASKRGIQGGQKQIGLFITGEISES